ncbi:hypothetical protein [Ruficoccus sp. ZRK36]|uniref:hypothetical protein n=1 Tax=Ruficoccus sp. ZRK36 TaxID=2866311 RepID=UPI001C739719|nr:hypothetical protein [Ruficoccus sp. ZRK36]QYY37324.1 hypothetical protein K0V07_07515 [Ruficoccus sp. ZRK36]
MKNKRSPLRGRISSKVNTDRAIEHLDSQSKQHRKDQEFIQEARSHAKNKYGDAFNIFPNTRLKYPSLKGGMRLDRDGMMLSKEQYKLLMKRISEDRGWYYSVVVDKYGRNRTRKRKTTPLRQIAISFRPDFALAFNELEHSKNPPVGNFLKNVLMPALVQEFVITTGLQIVASAVHPEEGMLHVHLIYSCVSEEHQLLWAKDGRGRRGVRLLGPSGTGVLRLEEGGLMDAKIAEQSRLNLRDRLASTQGEEPLDLRLSYTVDALCSMFFERRGLTSLLAKSRDQYRSYLVQKIKQRPESMKKEIRSLRDNLSEMEAKINKLQEALLIKKHSERRYLEVSIHERLKGIVPTEILRNSSSFQDILSQLYEDGTDATLKIVKSLASNHEIPVSFEEREMALYDISHWYVGRPDPGIKRTINTKENKIDRDIS